MLTFNLTVFFRNMAGAEVEFAAKNAQCALAFVGSVLEFRQQQDVGTHLDVALRSGDLVCHIAIVEEEALESPEDAKVEVTLMQALPEGEREVFQTAFRFEEISLKPYVPAPPPEEEQPQEPPPKAG